MDGRVAFTLVQEQLSNIARIQNASDDNNNKT